MKLKSILTTVAAVTLSLSAEPYKIASEASIDKRVETAKNHLGKTDGGKLLWESIKAHGGLEQWFSNGLLEFRWTYNMTDRGRVTDTTQIIDTWSSKARHTGHGALEGITFGWDGSKAWQDPADAKIGVPPAFWALTPYYFVGVPHVLADPGTIHALLPEKITYKGEDYAQVKVTYEDGTGESPDDYYIVLIHPETKLVKGVRYIVTAPILNRPGKPEEKLLTYEDWTEVSGVLMPSAHVTYTMNGDVIGDPLRTAKTSEVKFLGEAEVSFSGK